MTVSSRKISLRDYDSIHAWVRYRYGKASKCENLSCKGKSKTFQWAVKLGCQYERNIDNYMQLCRSCHAIYDITDETRVKIRNNNQARKTHCYRGHLFDEKNTFRYKGSRNCRECRRINNRERYKDGKGWNTQPENKDRINKCQRDRYRIKHNLSPDKFRIRHSSTLQDKIKSYIQ